MTQPENAVRYVINIGTNGFAAYFSPPSGRLEAIAEGVTIEAFLRLAERIANTHRPTRILRFMIDRGLPPPQPEPSKPKPAPVKPGRTPWAADIDPGTIPYDVIYSEVGRRRRAMRKTDYAPGTGRPKKLSPCKACGRMLGVAEKRGHFKRCPARKKPG